MAPKKKTKKQREGYASRARAVAARYNKSGFPGAEVVLPSADMSAPRGSFNTTGADKPCAPTKVPATCMLGQKSLKPKFFQLNKPSLSVYTAACKKVGGQMRDAYLKPIRAGKVDLNFFSQSQAAKRNTLPGPNLRLCLRDNEPGYLVPVSSPEVAAGLEQAFAKCTKGNKARTEYCAKKTVGEDAPLGGFPGTSRGLLGGLLGGR